MKNFILLFFILSLGVWGCVTVDNTTLIDTDKDGYAGGQFRDVRTGKVADVSIFGGGAGAAAASAGVASLAAMAASTAAGDASSATNSAARNSSSSGGGGGMFGIHIKPGPTQGDPVPFARSVAMINYSKRLKSIKYDEMGGVIEYDFGPGPLSMRSDSPASKGTKMPSAFGHQPVE
jgi:hypothetical protein